MTIISANTIVSLAQQLRTHAEAVSTPHSVTWYTTSNTARHLWHRQKPMRKKIARMMRDKPGGVR